MSSTATFADWLRHRRRGLDLTQEELAGLIGASPETIRKIEEGKRRPSKNMAELIAQHLAVPAAEIPAVIRLARMQSAGEVTSLHTLAEEIAAHLLSAASIYNADHLVVKVIAGARELAHSPDTLSFTIALEPRSKPQLLP